MGSCCSNEPKNKVSPLQDDDPYPKKVTDNFVRGRGDGESDVSDIEKGKSLDRNISGSSFSSNGSVASKSVDELNIHDDEDDILAHFGQYRKHGGLSRYDMLSEVNSEVRTEGGLTDVAIDLDHPFAPVYEGDEFDANNLSRPRTVGLRGRSSYARDMLSQLSNYSDLESLPEGPKREDTPVPGKRGGSNMSILSKRKGKRKGNISSRSKKSLQREDSDLYSAITPRSLRNDTPGSFSAVGSTFSVNSDDGGSSLNSSCSSLSAIGEMSENGSSAGAGGRKSSFTASNTGVISSPIPSKQPRLQLQTKPSKTKENVPPRPPPRPSKRSSNAPKSADLLKPAEKEPLPPAPKSADTLLGSRQNSLVKDDPVKAERPDIMSLSVDVSLATGKRSSVKPKPPERKYFGKSFTYNNNTTSSSTEIKNEMHTSNGSEDRKPFDNGYNYNNQFADPSENIYKTNINLAQESVSQKAWNDDVAMKHDIKRFNRTGDKPPIKPKPSSALYQNRLANQIPEKAMARTVENIKQMHMAEKTDALVERPMAARPRRPATAVESYFLESNKPLKQKLPHMIVSEEMYSDESMDEESHPVRDEYQNVIFV